jgi:iron(III) transport system ATP-binding protein
VNDTGFLSVHGLNVCYDDVQVIEDLSLDLRRGEIGCLLGASGCGKTTLLRVIAGFEEPRAGTVKLSDSVLSEGKRFVPPEQRGIGMVFQDFALFPHLTIERNVAFGLGGLDSRQADERIVEMLELVGLPQMRERYPHELSGGQQQRVAIARALAPRPRLLLLDEPFSGLDVELREQLAVEVRRILKSLDITALLVTHDQLEAFAVADKAGLMRGGEIIQWSSPYDLYHKPVNDYVAGFVGKGTLLPATLTSDRGVQTALGFIYGVAGNFPIPAFCQTCELVEESSALSTQGQDLPSYCHRDGCHMNLLIRPDDVIHDDDSELQLEIVGKVFRGSEFLYTLKVDDHHELLCAAPSHHNHQLNSKIGIRLDVEHMIVLGTPMPLSEGQASLPVIPHLQGPRKP